VLGLVVVEVLLPVDVGALDLAVRLLLGVVLALGRLVGRCSLASIDSLSVDVCSAGASSISAVAPSAGSSRRRVLLHLGADEVDQLQARELEQLDRLLQLGRHHQLLAEPEALL
jgi:hypothetical protein